MLSAALILANAIWKNLEINKINKLNSSW
jgi:hypothetical protein